MTREELRQKANDLPAAPGVYLMMDKTEKSRHPVFPEWLDS